MAKVYAIINQKGGVAKTTTTFNMGAEIANRGYKVLLIDMDPQGTLTESMGFKKNLLDKTVDGLISPLTLKKPIPEVSEYILKRKNLDLIPANIALSTAELLLVQATSREYVFKKVINKIKETYDYDYILIDCPPTLGMLVVNILTAANSIIVPIAATEIETPGFADLIETVKYQKMETNPDLYIEGVLMTKFNNRLKESKKALNIVTEICEQYGIVIFDAKIKHGTVAPQAYGERKTINEYAGNSEVAKNYRDFVTEVLNAEQ